MRQGAAGVGAQIDRQTRVMCGGDCLVTAGVQVAHVRGIGRVLVLSGSGNPREGVDVHQGRDDRNPLGGKGVDGFRVKPGRMLFEIEGITEDLAKKSLALAAAKLPLKTRFVKRMEG